MTLFTNDDWGVKLFTREDGGVTRGKNVGLGVPFARVGFPLRVPGFFIVGKGVVTIWFALKGFPFCCPDVLSSESWLLSCWEVCLGAEVVNSLPPAKVPGVTKEVAGVEKNIPDTPASSFI